MSFYDPDKVPIPDPAFERAEAERRAALAAGSADERARALAQHNALPSFDGSGYVIVYPGFRLDGQPCPAEARLAGAVGDARHGEVWASAIIGGEPKQFVVCPAVTAGAARRAVEADMWR